jgi:quercetin dioxygenase-like cupin family protein
LQTDFDKIMEEVIIKTEDVSVRVLNLDVNEVAPWHFHSEVIDNMFCLTGTLRVCLINPDKTVILLPGERCEVKPGRVHRVENQSQNQVKYLLVQGVGQYDFNIVDVD